VAVLPAGHGLAEQGTLAVDDLNRERLILPHAWSEDARAAWAVDPRPDGSHPVQGPRAQTLGEILECVAAGRGYAIVPASLQHSHARADLRFVALSDAPALSFALVWPGESAGPPARRFVDYALAFRDRVERGAGDGGS